MKLLPWAIAIAAVALAGTLWFRGHSKLTRLEERAEVLRHYCIATKDGFHDDWTAFASGDLRKQEAAYARFYDGQVMYHNVSSFMMCTNKEPPKLPSECMMNKDWDCLADLARQMKDLLP